MKSSNNKGQNVAALGSRDHYEQVNTADIQNHSANVYDSLQKDVEMTNTGNNQAYQNSGFDTRKHLF